MQRCCKTKDSFTFASLQSVATILFRKTAVTLLLLLFVSIHVAKLFHQHTDSVCVNHSADAQKTVVKASVSCAICDYHFTKDVDAVTTFAVVQPSLHALSFSSFYILPATTSIGLPSADRGPPAIV